MPITSRTIGPLHFEDLEPKRFEDLVRQLVYDFKPWRRLEATGRAGSDDGFDARGYEIAGPQPTETDDEPEPDVGQHDKLWLVQCKRERTITPKKLNSYLEDVYLADGEFLHGLILAAACDFSKKSRDMFAKRCREIGLVEWHLWGKAELEDMLFQPKNDNLLFAYFGFSLAIRARSKAASVRSRLATKRKVKSRLEGSSGRPLLLRALESDAYPYLDGSGQRTRNPAWIVRRYSGLSHEGIKFVVRRHFAYLSDDAQTWDAALLVDDAEVGRYENPWSDHEDAPERQLIWQFWDSELSNNKAWFEVEGIVPFEWIVDIDDIGDDWFSGPHVIVDFDPARGPFQSFRATITPTRSYDRNVLSVSNDRDKRVVIFREEWRKPRSMRAKQAKAKS